MTEAAIIHAIASPRLQTLLQEQGYRVTVSEQNGLSQLLSASQGIGFALRFGNPAQTKGEFVDYTMSCALRVQGDLPAGLVDTWNTSKRFARLSVQGHFLVLEMDVILAGGVTENHLRANTELWDRLLQELVLFLRQYMQAQPEGGASAAPVANGEAVSA
ncbi:YbjN domain-containing protein [Pseudomonadota bacterium AL_CKDN230030165-1A_HGKHYDSX7]